MQLGQGAFDGLADSRKIKEQEQEFRKAIGERDMALQEKETQLEEQNRVIEELKRKLELLDQTDK